MKKILCLLFISIYALLGMKLIIELFRFCSIYFGPFSEILIDVIWLTVSFSGDRWITHFDLALMRVRKTILEEEEWIHPLMHELNLRSGIIPHPRLLIWENPEMTAFASGRETIVVSRGLLIQLSELEIKAILAHEYGHLISRDTQTSTALEIASKPGNLIYNLTRTLFGFVRKLWGGQTKFWTKLVLVAVVITCIYVYPNLVLLFAILFIFMKLFPSFSQLISLIWCSFSRSDEFQQDRFAESMGCGRYLKSALLKLDSLHSDRLVNRLNQFWMTHPMIYARIRRLEWLEGLRPTP